MTSASSIARSAAARIASWSLYSGSSSPGESVKMYCVSSLVSSPTTGSRVDWGLGDTIARCSPTSAFSSVDLPTFGRPARTIVPQRVMVQSVEERTDLGYPPSSAKREKPMTARWLAVSLLTLVVPTFAQAQIEQNVKGEVDHFGPGFTAL